LILSVVSGLTSYFYDYLIIDWIYKIDTLILMWLMIVSILWVIVEKNILWWETKFFQYKEITNDKTDILFGFLPIYNIFMRYKIHTFDSPYWRAKESILWRLLFILVSLIIKNVVFSSFILVLIIIRIASLMSGIDIISDEIKKKINNVFYKNPEEIRWYVSGSIIFVIEKFTLHSALDKETKLDLNDSIKQEKKKYQILSTFQIDNKLYIQYWLLVLILLMWIYTWISAMNQWIYIIPSLMIWLRYIVMYWKWKHLPNLPLLKEFTDLIYYIFEFVKPYLKKFYPNQKQKNDCCK
jgi:nitrogen fixation-related uncharacterized protein